MSTYFLLDPFEFPYYFYHIFCDSRLSEWILFERIQKKICRHKMSIMFNEICINEEMLPKYTYFKLHDPAAHKYNITLEYRRDLVKRQITLCKNNIHSLNLESQKIR